MEYDSALTRKKILPFVTMWMNVEVIQFSHSVVSVCDPMDWSLPGSSVHGISQARILEWVAISDSRGSS